MACPECLESENEYSGSPVALWRCVSCGFEFDVARQLPETNLFELLAISSAIYAANDFQRIRSRYTTAILEFSAYRHTPAMSRP